MELRPAELEEALAGPCVALAVSDTGPGMDAETRARLFEPFFSPPGSGRSGGLGLASVHGVVRQSGGHLRVASEPGRGSRIEILLPRAEARRGRPVASPPAPLPAPAGGRVLVVDDEPGVRDLVREILGRAGWQVVATSDPEAAVRLVDEGTGPFDLLVADVAMPRLGGPALASRLTAVLPELRTLFVSSGYLDGPLTGALADSAATAFLPKPFTPDALLDAVGRLTGQARGGTADTTGP